MFRLLPVLAALAGSASAQVCPAKYTECPNCCDINNDCRCDSFCPMHPEVWAVGCALPKKQVDKPTAAFVCPVGYTKCKDCCDINGDCKCDDKCGRRYPKGFQCSLTPGDDEYTSAGKNAVCPGGFTDCGSSCNLSPDCRHNACPLGMPRGFRCSVPKRTVVKGSIHIFQRSTSWNNAERDCVRRGGHLASLHSSEDFRQLNRALAASRTRGAIFIGGYERRKENDWQWIDGSPMDRSLLNRLGFKPDNYGKKVPQGMKKNENEMAYCNANCARAYGWPKSVIGIHDWGRRQTNSGQGTVGYACRITRNAPSPPKGGGNPFQINGKSYTYHPEPLYWATARGKCQVAGGDLASVHSLKENLEIARNTNGASVWIGLSDYKKEGLWTWSDGTPVKFSHWNKGEPNNAHSGAGEDFGDFAGGRWNDLPNKKLPYVCEVGDLKSDAKTKVGQQCRLAYAHGSSSGGSWDQHANDKSLSWSDARKFCRTKGEDIPIIHDAAQNKQIVDLLENTRFKGAWLGLTDNRKDGRWEWIDDELATYTNWNKGEPNGGTHENCAHLYGGTGKWNDRSCTATDMAVVCCSGGLDFKRITKCDAGNFNKLVKELTEHCCDQKGETCKAGVPETCPRQCAEFVIPFADACKKEYRKIPAMTHTMNKAVANCLRKGHGH